MQGHIIDAVVKGVLVGLFMAISVGPTLFAVIRYSLHYSYKAGIAFVFGVSVSDFIYVAIANVAATWLEVLRPYEQYIAYGGAVALMIIGLSGLVKKHKPQRPSAVPILISRGGYFRIWLSGFLINTLNPGVLVTWLGAVTMVGGATAFYRFILFGTCLVVILGIDFLKIFLAEKIKGMLTLRRIIYMNRFSSACILAIGAVLMVTTALHRPNTGNEKGQMDRILAE